MALVSELMALGMAGGLARKLGVDPATTYAAAGTNQATATLLTATFANVTIVAANTGVRLPSALVGQQVVLNNGANVLTIYPAVGDKINGGAANSGIVITVGKTAFLIGDGNQWAANISA